MRKLSLIFLIGVVCLLIGLTLKSFDLSTYTQKKIAKLEYKLANYLAIKPQKIAVSGNLGKAEISVSMLYTSPSWKSLTNNEGDFFIPEVLWYPGKIYTLVFIDKQNALGKLDIFMPWNLPKSGVWDIGNINFNSNKTSDLTFIELATSYTKYDINNQKYYQEKFFEITNNKLTTEEKIAEVNQYISKLRVKKNRPKIPIKSAKELLSTPNFSYSCGEMSNAMATLLKAANYKVRLLNVMKEGENNSKSYTHALVEVFYNDQWHLYDPTYGIAYLKENNVVASYAELRSNPELLVQHPLVTRGSTLASLYETGIHYIVYFN